MTDAFSGVGTVLRKWDGTGWVSLGEVKSVSGPSMSRNTIDVTSLASTGGYSEFITGLRDPGSLTFTINFVRSDYNMMKNDFESDTAVDYEMVLPDAQATSFEMSGLVTDLPLDVPFSDAVTCNVTIKLSGQITINTGAASGALP